MGTTIEILAPYLPYGIEIQHQGWGGRHVLTGLVTGEYAEGAAQAKGAGDVRLGYVLPVLYDFSDLCTTLPDGTVPAVEVARLALGGEAEDIDWNTVKARPTNEEGTQSIDVVSIDGEDDYEWSLVTISNTFDTDCDGNFTVNHVAIIDYLRRNLFALPVNGKLLAEGVDFIRKTR